MTNTNKIQNPVTQVPSTSDMNDRDFLNDMLATEKYMTTSYSTALNEASHANLYNSLSNVFSETQNCQRNLFELMFKKGWYSFEATDRNTLQQTYQQFTGYTNQLPSSNLTN